MRTNKKKQRQGLVAYLLFAVVGVQVAIYLVWKNSGESDTDYVAEATPEDAAPVDNSFVPDLYDPHAVPEESATESHTTENAGQQRSRQGSLSQQRRHGRSSDRKQPASTGTVTNQDQSGTLSITTAPNGAAVRIDGIFAGKSPLWNVAISPGQHNIALAHPKTFDRSISVTIVTGSPKTLSEHLEFLEPQTPVAATVAQRSPRTPRVSSKQKGSISRGKSILSSACNSCHRKAGRANVGPGLRTASQWQRFFSRGSHDRYQRIGQDMNSGQLGHVKTYLMSKAAGTERNQGAGVRK